MARVFRPSLLSMIGTAAPFGLAALFFQANMGFLGAVYGFAYGLLGGLLLAIALLLFVDPRHRRLWGAVVAVLYGLGYPGIYIQFFFIPFVSLSATALTVYLGLAGLTVHTLGLIGGVWGILARTPRPSRTPQASPTVTGPAP